MNEQQLTDAFAALADPTRRAILARLAQGDATVNELAAPFELTLPTVSKHLKVLRRAGLISQARDAQRRPCRLEPASLLEAAKFLERFGEIWSERFGQLDAYLCELQTQNQEKKR